MPQHGDCSPRLFNDALPEWRGSDRTLVVYCDSTFAWVGQYQTDWVEAFEFRDGRWWPVEHAGTTQTGLTRAVIATPTCAAGAPRSSSSRSCPSAPRMSWGVSHHQSACNRRTSSPS